MNRFQNDVAISAVYGRCVEIGEAQLDVWNHTNNVCYVQWMQDVAVEHSDALGWNSSRYLDSGAIWVVRSHWINYHKSTYKGDKLLIQTWIAEMKRASCLRRYRFLELPKNCDTAELDKKCRFANYETFKFPETALVATAETHWAFVSATNFRPVKVFPELTEVFETVKDYDAEFPGETDGDA